MTPHFSYDELVFSQTATRLGIPNIPNKTERQNLKATAQMMEVIRAILGNYVISISSGFRCEQLNRILHGSATSQHMLGKAVDFTCRNFGDPKAVCLRIIRRQVKFDQIIYEGRWIHISIANEPRGSILTASFGKDGINYSEGIS